MITPPKQVFEVKGVSMNHPKVCGKGCFLERHSQTLTIFDATISGPTRTLLSGCPVWKPRPVVWGSPARTPRQEGPGHPFFAKPGRELWPRLTSPWQVSPNMSLQHSLAVRSEPVRLRPLVLLRCVCVGFFLFVFFLSLWGGTLIWFLTI